MTNGRRKHGKHSAALPETQPASARETVAKTGAMTHRELEEKFATKEELKHSEKFLVEKMDHGFQLHSQELRSVETNLTQQIDASTTNLNQKIDANEARAEERAKRLESTIEQQSEKNLYKTAFLVVVIGGSLSGLTYGVYQLVKFLTGG